MDESRALQRAGWAGAASLVLLVIGLALTYLVGVDQASMSDASILERLEDGEGSGFLADRIRPTTIKAVTSAAPTVATIETVLDRENTVATSTNGPVRASGIRRV